MTQSIEVKDFTGGANNIVNPFNIYPNEAESMKNVTVNTTGLITKNYILDAEIIPPKAQPTDPIQIAPLGTFKYDLTTSIESYYEKVRFYQGENYMLINGVPNRLKDGVSSPAFVTTALTGDAPQNTTLGTPDLTYTTIEKYTYFMSYRNSAGFESSLLEIGTVFAHRTFNGTFSVETMSAQDVTVSALPSAGDYIRIYRMGGSISFPSLVFQSDSTGAITLNKVGVSYSALKFTFSAFDDDLGEYGETWGAVNPPYLKYLTATKFGLAAANGSQVYLSMNKPDAWSAFNMLNFGSPIVAIASVYSGFLVFTESTYLYLVSGSSLGNLRVDLLSTDVGCSSNSSIAEVGQHALIWIHKRRFYVFNGSSVQELEPHTYDYLFFLLQGYDKDITAISYEGQYYASTVNGMVSIDLLGKYKPFVDFDLETTVLVANEASYLREFQYSHQRRIGAYKPDGSFWSLREYIYGDPVYVDEFPENDGWAMGAYTNPPIADTDSTQCVYLGGFSGYLEVVPDPCPGVDGALIGNYTNNGVVSTPSLYRSLYKGPRLAFNTQTATSKFHAVEVLYEGELLVNVYIDDILVATKESINPGEDLCRVLIPSNKVKGKYIQVELSFDGKISSYRVDGEVEQAK